QRLELAVRVEGVQRRITEVVEEIAVKLVGAAPGDRVHLSAGGLAELYRVVRSLRLEFLDRVDGVDIRCAGGTATSLGEQHLVVVRAVHVVLVVKTADAVEAHQTRAAVLRNVRRIQYERAPIARCDGKVGDQLLVDRLRDLGLVRIENRNRRRNLDRRGHRPRRQSGVDREDLSYGERQVLVIDLAE